MKPWLASGLVLALASVTVIGGHAAGLREPPAAPARPASPADAAWDRLAGRFKDGVGGPEYVAKHRGSLEDFLRWWENFRREYRDLGLKFWADFPSDPRRFTWLRQSMNLPPTYYKDFDQGIRLQAARTPELAEIDAAAAAAWARRYEPMRAEYMASTELDQEAKASLRYHEIYWQLQETNFALARGAEPDLAQWSKVILDFGAMYPENTGSSSPASLMEGFIFYRASLWRLDQEAMAQLVARLKTSPNPDLRELGSGKAQLTELRRQAMDLKFTAIDGRKVDLSSLRGKVVLIDVWATWCGACIAELPNLKSVQAKYREQGFEVVGVSRDRPTDRQKLTTFVAKENLPWPQWFDEPATAEFSRKFSVLVVPTTFLLDKEGRLVSTEARGKKLEPLVRQHLGLPPLSSTP